MWVQIKVTLFNALVALVLWVGMHTGHNFFKFVFGKTFGYTEEGWTKLTRNVALFFLAYGHRQRSRAAGLSPMRTSLRSTASSRASISGSFSRSSSSCR